MSEFKADLHCHTTCSDGSKTPEQIVALAKEIGLSGLAITDHDTIDAYQTAIRAARLKNLSLISGVEISSTYKNINVDILAYSFALENSKIQEFCERHRLSRKERNISILKLLSDNKMYITEEEIPRLSLPSTGRPHMAKILLKKGYVSSYQEAFDLYLAEGKKCYVPGESFTIEETIETIHASNGFAVIAHPYIIKNPSIIPELFQHPFDGVECFYGLHKPNEEWIKIAEKKNWLITGGSDFHGDAKPQISLGCSWAAEPVFRVLEERHKQNNSNVL